MEDEVHLLFSIGRPEVDGDEEEGAVDVAAGVSGWGDRGQGRALTRPRPVCCLPGTRSSWQLRQGREVGGPAGVRGGEIFGWVSSHLVAKAAHAGAYWVLDDLERVVSGLGGHRGERDG